MDIITKAKELGESIASSKEMENLKNSEIELEKDRKAKELLNDYKLLQMELVRATKEKREKEIIDSIRLRLMSKQDELNDYDVTKNYLSAKATFDKLMKTVNDVIVFSISGEEPCSPKKCGSCGGGCK